MFLRTFQGLTAHSRREAVSNLTANDASWKNRYVIVHFGNNLLIFSQNRLTTLLSKQNCKFNVNISTLNKAIFFFFSSICATPPYKESSANVSHRAASLKLHYTSKAHCLALKFARRPASWVFSSCVLSAKHDRFMNASWH